METLSFKLNSQLYLKDPQSTELGQKIISHSIKLIDKLGFEQFNFKHLAASIRSTEASVYRYFENKHRLLIYLIDWYWNWIEYKLDRQLMNIANSKEKLRIAIKILTQQKINDPQFAFVDEHILQKIVFTEFEKTYLTKHVDADNKDGLFLPYKIVCQKISDIIEELNPNYAFPKSLVSTMLLTVNHQLYYAKHLPSLSDIRYESKDKHEELFLFVVNLIANTIGVTDHA